MDYVAQQVMNALAFGAEYALLALGLAIVFSIMGLVNFAHGEIIAVGGYTMVAMASLALNNPLIVMGAAILAAAVASVTLERVAFRPVRYADPTTGLLTAFGVSIVLQNVFLLAVSPRPIAVTSLYFLEWPIELGNIRISSLQLFETLTTLTVIVLMVVFLKRTVLGLAMRAAALDFEMVRLSGIRANRVFAAAFLISGLLAGIACVFIMARRGSVDPHLGFDPVLMAFVACVVGGFGSLPGAVLGGFLLGAIE
ncbi:MAG: branched-chain amino acid ABC transporter permease, partial [Pseudomonadota bacterium]